ncbi:MAG: NfeD family protein [Tidjanibacter sp.]|nr:NfeD family protein [Tidjanibacter sp.]
MWSIIILLVIGILLLFAEFLLLPGTTVAGFCSLAAYGFATYLGFADYGTKGGYITLGIAILTAAIVIIVSLKSKNWQRFALANKIESRSMESPQEESVEVGQQGVAVTRLAPIGRIEINGKNFEAKSVDAFIDQKSKIEVVGFENFSVLVKKIQ